MLGFFLLWVFRLWGFGGLESGSFKLWGFGVRDLELRAYRD